jgi:hypothetical protein
MAIEASSGRLVVVTVADPGRLSTLEPARGVKQRHLATVIDVVTEVAPRTFPESVKLPVGAGAAVAEHVPGRTLRAVIAEGPLHPAKAVAWTLRLIDALSALHSAGAVHGAISPRSVIAEPAGRAIAPVLSQLIAPPVGAFCPPERLRGTAESTSDDVWALCATLHAALTGKAPFAASTREGLLKVMGSRPAPLATAGVNDPVLQEIIGRGLVTERRLRMTDLAELQTALDGWERDPKRMPAPRPPPRAAPRALGDIVVGTAFGGNREDGVVVDDSALPDDQGSALSSRPSSSEVTSALPGPPVSRRGPVGPAPAAFASQTGAAVPVVGPVPAVPGVAKRPSRRVSFNPFERKRPLWPWLVVAAVVGGAGVYLALPQAAPTLKAEPSAEPAPARRAPPPPPVKKNAELVRNQCVTQHFAEGSFEAEPDFAFVCEDGDFPALSRRLHAMVVTRDADAGADAGVGNHDGGMRVDIVRYASGRDAGAGARGVGLEWYELPATAIIRKTCCPQASPVILPETQGWCEQLQSVVRRMADDSAKSVDLGPGARSFDKAVGCLYANRVRHGYGYSSAPTSLQRGIFQQFLSRAAIIGARR